MKYRINVEAVPHTPHEVCAQYAKASVARFPLVQKDAGRGKPLAIVGGGHPLDLDALRDWSGDIWAVNGTHDWLLDQGISSYLFMGDPHPCMIDYVHKAEKAVMASICHPTIFDALEGKDVSLWHIGDVCEDAPFVARGVNTAASRAHMVGIWMGYCEQHYFGFSGSYVDAGVTGPANSHVYVKPEEHSHDQQLIIQADGEYFRTNLALMQQCEFFAEIFQAFPEYFHERSGGLLRAMMADSQWGVTHISDAVRSICTTQKEAA